MSSTFLILGGTGKVGRRLARSLTAAGHEPRPASRHAPVRFDWRDPGTWAGALAGADGVFIVGPGSAADWSPSLTRLLAAASSAGTPEGYIEWRMAMLGGIRRGADAYLSDGVQQVLGRPPASLREWATREVPSAAWA